MAARHTEVLPGSAALDGAAHRRARRQQFRQRHLHRRVHREVGVQDQLKPLARLRHQVGVARRPPSTRASAAAARTTSTGRRARTPVAGGSRARDRTCRTRAGGQRPPGRPANTSSAINAGRARRTRPCSRSPVGHAQDDSRRVVRRDDDHGARARCPCGIEAVEIHAPAPVAVESVGTALHHVLQRGEVTRTAGSWAAGPAPRRRPRTTA